MRKTLLLLPIVLLGLVLYMVLGTEAGSGPTGALGSHDVDSPRASSSLQGSGREVGLAAGEELDRASASPQVVEIRIPEEGLAETLKRAGGR